METSDSRNASSRNEQKSLVPSISLPKGGGAIRGMGEKFAANPVTGTGSMSVPIATSPGRSGFGPQLSLSYDSGAGNGPFGFGWSLSLPAITRKTDKGLPQYLDAIDSDVFILSGSEDLVPVYRQDPEGTRVAAHPTFKRDPEGGWVRDASGRFLIHEDDIDGYRVRHYRPRIEGLFARIERWSRIGSPGDVHWRSISKENVLTLYGYDANSRIADPLDAGRIFSWLICETRDDKGNGIRYLYKNEDGAAQLHLGQADPFNQSHQLNRGDAADPGRTAQRYLHRVLYGNVRPLLDDTGQRPRRLSDLSHPPKDTDADWLFEVRFDYGELDKDNPTDQPEKPWFYRPDAFSTYRAGFEVRTCRRCERVLMLHHIPDMPAAQGNPAMPGYQGVVRSTEFTYDDELEHDLASKPIYSFLKEVVQTGWKQEGGVTTRRSLPPLRFEYSQPKVQELVEEVDPDSLENLPIGLDGTTYRWVDLHGEGIPGILTEQAGAWYYKRNWSPIPMKQPDGSERVMARFSPLETVALKPNVTLGAGAEIMDLAGDGQPDVVVMEGATPGLYEHDEAEGWQPFRPFTSRLNRDTRDPNLKFVDLDGDGHADVLITEGDALVWHSSLGEEGFGPARRVAQARDEEKGPRIVFADGTQSIYLADLSGDGLADLCRIRNDEVCYWPNLGYGRFGAKITMDNPPTFDNPDQFDPKRIRLADIDGSGTTDIIYLHGDGVRLYFNQSGNGWSQPQTLKVFPRIDNLVSIIPIDLLGNGTACLVWSSPLPGDARRPMRYVNLMGGQKPHLLVKTVNNLGAETRVDYAPSTKFYLRDKRDGKPWITRLPFPVHVVERVETIDHISRNRFVTRYAYHHGYFDGEEREFRGFGMVEQWDAERINAVAREGNAVEGYLNEAAAFTQPPVHTKTWFHTGVYDEVEEISQHFATEYFGAPKKGEPGYDAAFDAFFRTLLPDTVIPPNLTPEEEREACRALKGMMLRQEVYADDADHPGATPQQIQRALTPYTVTEQNFAIRVLQQQNANRHGVFLSHPNEAITYHYERNPADPRLQHALTLEVDDFGNVLKQAAIGYGRRRSPLPEAWDQERQTATLLTYTENRVTNVIEAADQHRTPLPCEAITYELTDYAPTGAEGRYQAKDFVEPDPSAPGLCLTFADQVPYEAEATGKPCRRPIEWIRTLYRPNDLGDSVKDANRLLKLKELESLALPGESYKLAFTPGLLNTFFQRSLVGQPSEPLLPDPGAILGGQGSKQGGYLQSQTLKADGRFPVSDADDHWWIPSGRSFFSENPKDTADLEQRVARGHFFLPRRTRDPFGQAAIVDYDAFDLLTKETRDALGNRVTVETNDYRVLQPRLVSDPNRNQTEVTFDTLGLVAGTAVMGKPAPAPVEGDTLAGFLADLTTDQLDEFMGAPRQASTNPKVSEATPVVHDLLQGATTRIVYDLDRFKRLGEPPFAATIARETHVSDLKQNEKSKLHVSFSYSDGFGREIQKKIQAEPGKGPTRDTAGKIILDANGLPVPTQHDVNPRWVGSGWTIFNNKGKPVRQYEPFFTDTHDFEFDALIGVSPVLFYDPVERVVATLHPNHTYEKVVFDPWQQTTWDVNDTVASFDPTSRKATPIDPSKDPDMGGFLRRLPQETYLPTWYDLRTDQAKALIAWPDEDAQGQPLPDNAKRRDTEREAAHKAAAHASTPTTAHFDALGRPFLTVARNRVVCPGHALDGKPDEEVRTRVELDIEGNQRRVFDERKLPVNHLPTGAIEQRGVMRYAYHMAGPEKDENGGTKTTHRIHQASMEAGERWMLHDVLGKPIRAWDSRGHTLISAYDALRRPIEQLVRGTFHDPEPLKPNSDPRTLGRDILVDKIEYGEPPPDPTEAQEKEAQRLNLRTRIFRHFDSAGVVINARMDANGEPTKAYDFKGNLLHSTRRLARDYKGIPDWLLAPEPQLEAEGFEGSTRYDALNRPIQSIAPHSRLKQGGFNVLQPVFNDANLMERVDVWLERKAEPAALLDPQADPPSPVGVANIDYDAKGQRILIDYKTKDPTVIRTRYAYDPRTFRLVHLYTRRGVDPTTAQGVAFTDDCESPTPPPDAIAAPDQPPGTPCGLQNLHYTYDPAGNITHIRDDAQQTLYFKNKRIEPSNDYVYDALHRLIQAKGREHLGQGGQPVPHSHGDEGRVGILSADAAGRFAPNDAHAMDTYTERYVYDAVGNFLQMQHRGSDANHPGWTRRYTYEEASLIERNKWSNRLSRTQVGNGISSASETYPHEVHGNMVGMPHLTRMDWDYRDQLQATSRQVVNDTPPPDTLQHTTTYVYDASGQRVRKVWEKKPGLIEERIYLGGFEIIRRHSGPIGANTATLERETLHVMDDQQRIALVETRTLDIAGDDKAPRQWIQYQLGNHLSSASLELDEQAQIISYEEYAPYGSSTYQAVRSRTETAKRYRYTGKERDEESGLYYHGARHYAPWLGRWCSAEPMGIESGVNLYEYAKNNCISLIDPDGQTPQESSGSYQRFFNHYIPELILFSENKAAIKTFLKWDNKANRYVMRTDIFHASHYASGDRVSSNQHLAIEFAKTNFRDGRVLPASVLNAGERARQTREM